MCRASVWAYGDAFAWQKLERDEQIDLYNLYIADKYKTLMENKLAFKLSIAETISEMMSAARSSDNSDHELSGSRPAPSVAGRGSPKASDRVMVLPDKARPGLSPAQLVADLG